MTSDFDVSELRAKHLYDGLQESPCSGEELMIPGPAGDIEALTRYPEGCPEGGPVAVLCHPHPLYGGSMANKVVHILSDTFNELGVPTVRFNFRGVGHSVGRFDRGVGETQDLLAVLDWVRARHPASPLWLAGFSFGAYVALRAVERAEVQGLLLIAPPLTIFDFGDLPEVEVPWMVVQGGKDEVISPHAVSRWVHERRNRPQYTWMAEADHFFHGRLNRLREAIKRDWPGTVSPA
ncbi:MAG TPA: alpha/beta fold hydrolase [Gammaproteobacteria bacterium]|nr:alpha/beta fold hydrolase [Gammaproteobacteria bacterium]